MGERLGNLGYMAVKKEVTAGIPLIPSVFMPLYNDDISTMANQVEDNPIIGNQFKRYAILPGQRGYKGKVSVQADPNLAAYLFDMMMTIGNVSGSDPYTYLFTPALTQNSYTIDISGVSQVFRFVGAQISQIAMNVINNNEITLDCDITALHAFGNATVASTSGSGPYTIVLDTSIDPNPSTGLVIADTMTLAKAAGGTVNFAVATIVDSKTITTITDVTSAVAGDAIFIRPATPTYVLKSPMLWSQTEFRFAATASAALSAAQTNLESGSMWTLMNPFENDEGAKRSGSLDPISLPRLQYDGSLKIKKFFDSTLDFQKFQQLTKLACVIRHFVYSGGKTYELRITYHHLKFNTTPKPKLLSNGILYTEADLLPQYDTADSASIEVAALNGLASL